MSLKTPAVALYIHVPFCQARCTYCDFNTYAGLESTISAYTNALCREIERAGERWNHPSTPTIYFGGGTPTLLTARQIAQILVTVRDTFNVTADAEVSLEANPGTVDARFLSELHSLGVNRLSLGAQSAQAEELKLLGRIHTWSDVVAAVEAARSAGFDSLSVDFIYGLPEQSLTRWQQTLEAALSLHPNHLSLYSLGVEEGTPLYASIAEGALPAPDDDRAADMLEWAEQFLAEAGFFHYEISNWAAADLEGRRWWPAEQSSLRRSEGVSGSVCRHNLVYWRNEPWIGVGAGAHSWMDGQRWANVLHPHAYVDAIEREGSAVDSVERIERDLEMGETMMLGLRLAEGVTTGRFQERFGVSLEEVYGETLDTLEGLGLVSWDGQTARLTGRGRLIGNRVFAYFI